MFPVSGLYRSKLEAMRLFVSRDHAVLGSQLAGGRKKLAGGRDSVYTQYVYCIC